MSEDDTSVILGSKKKRKSFKKRKREDEERTSAMQEEYCHIPNIKTKKHKANDMENSLGTSLVYESDSEIVYSSQKEVTRVSESEISEGESFPSVSESGVFSLKSDLDAMDKKTEQRRKRSKLHSKHNDSLKVDKTDSEIVNGNETNKEMATSGRLDQQEVDPFDGDEDIHTSDRSADNLPLVNIDEMTVDDVDDLIYFAETNYDLPSEMIERLSELEIPLTFEVPESHQIETRISHDPTPDQQEKFERIGIEMKRGKFNPEEDAIIRKNWESFCKEFHFKDPRPFVLMSYNGKKYIKTKERIHFVQYLGNGLPHRYLHGIYRRFRTLYSPRKVSRTRFPENLDKIIMECVDRRINNPFSKLASVTSRDRLSIYRRFCVLQSKENFKGLPNVQWTQGTAEKLVKALMKICEVSDIEELRGETVSWSTWQLVAEEVGHRPEAVQRFWERKLSTQIFATQPIFRKQLILDLAERLLEMNVKYWQDVKWKELSSYFHDATPQFLVRQLTRVKERIPKSKWPSMRDYLLFVKETIPKLKIYEAVLQRYKVKEDGTLLPIDDIDKYLPDEILTDGSSESE